MLSIFELKFCKWFKFIGISWIERWIGVGGEGNLGELLPSLPGRRQVEPLQFRIRLRVKVHSYVLLISLPARCQVVRHQIAIVALAASKKKAKTRSWLYIKLKEHLAILTLSLPSTTFAANGLNFWVRDVTRYFPIAIGTPNCISNLEFIV